MPFQFNIKPARRLLNMEAHLCYCDDSFQNIEILSDTDDLLTHNNEISYQ